MVTNGMLSRRLYGDLFDRLDQFRYEVRDDALLQVVRLVVSLWVMTRGPESESYISRVSEISVGINAEGHVILSLPDQTIRLWA